MDEYLFNIDIACGASPCYLLIVCYVVLPEFRFQSHCACGKGKVGIFKGFLQKVFLLFIALLLVLFLYK